MKNFIKKFDEECLKGIAKSLHKELDRCEEFACIQMIVYAVALIILLIVVGLTLGCVAVLTGIATALVCIIRIYSHLGHYEDGDYD